jgi:hypothetical protein
VGTGKRSLAELMGSSAAGHAGTGGLRLSHLPEILGDAMPSLPKDPIGRHRLIMALHQRFGPGFRSLPGVSGLVDQFDQEIEFERKVAQLKAIKYEPKRKGK